jgi:hypothetical protein
MNREQPSTTAVIAAVGRGDHRLSDPPPWILDDPFALMLVGPEWREVLQSPPFRLRRWNKIGTPYGLRIIGAPMLRREGRG